MTASNKTKENIAKAFVALTEQKPINKITVREIAAKSGVTTVTFYNYFLDKYDLAIWLHVKESKKIMAKINGRYEWKNTLLEGLRYFAKNRNFMLNALNHTGGHNGFLRRVERINEELLTAEIKKKFEKKTLPLDIQYAIKVYCAGTVRVLFDWLVYGMPVLVEDLAKYFEESLPQPLHRFLLRDAKPRHAKD
mgnify:FL=1